MILANSTENELLHLDFTLCSQQLVTQHRLQALRMPNPGQDHQAQQQQNPGPRMILQQQLQQQSPQVNRIAIANTQQAQAPINQPPPPPYPGPPPPYPGNTQVPVQQSSTNQVRKYFFKLHHQSGG